MLVLSLIGSPALATPAAPAAPEVVAAAVAACGTGYTAAAGQAFVLKEPGKPWDGHSVVPALGDDLCLVHQAPDKAPVALHLTLVSCMNCSIDAVDGLGFADVNGDGVPDVSLVASGVVGWDPQELSGERFVGGAVFAVWTADATWSTLTELPAARDVKGKTLKELWAALKAATP